MHVDCSSSSLAPSLCLWRYSWDSPMYHRQFHRREPYFKYLRCPSTTSRLVARVPPSAARDAADYGAHANNFFDVFFLVGETSPNRYRALSKRGANRRR
jgi:hypothetical protein